jgi:hypothetical protein
MRNLHLLTQTFSQDGQLSGTHQINGVWPPHTESFRFRAIMPAFEQMSTNAAVYQ